MNTPAQTTVEVHDTHTFGRSAAHMEALGWAFTHAPTQEAYRRSTGEDAALVLERYRQWVEENVVGSRPVPRISQSLAPSVSRSSVQR